MKRITIIITLFFTLLLTSCGGSNSDIETSTSPVQTAKADQVQVETQEKTISMENTLFIGDSRTVGICEYAGLNDADFFATVGMSVYNVFDDKVSVPNVGKITLNELLKEKDYDKVYIMLGINEIGYQTDQTLEKYAKLLDTVKQAQPDAILFVQGNLHVTKELSQSDDIINNEAINRLNTSISKFADNKRIFYLDINPVFDDAEGNLDEEKTSDKIHIYAKYYIDWGKWIIEETTAILSEADH